MHRLYVVAFPELSRSDATQLEALRAAHDPGGYALLKAHFTFVFGCTGISSNVLERAMRSVANGMGAIEFCLSRPVLSTHGDFHYVFLCPDRGADGMVELHRRLHAGHLDHNQQFTPHLTLCKTSDRGEAEQLVDQLRRSAIRIPGSLAALSLGELRDGQFHRLSDVTLMGTEPA